MNKKYNVGVIGAAGYTGGELLRLLINHPLVDIAWAYSESNAGKFVWEVHEGLAGDTDLKFADSFDLENVDAVFLCQGHGYSKKFWEEHPRPAKLKVIDLAQDYRDESEGYVYGLPEYQRERIKNASLLANPGCFATAIQLALLPLANDDKIKSDVNITGITGSTGAGVKPGATTHFSWRNDNISVYKAFEHQHLIEIKQTLSKAAHGNTPNLHFLPMRGDFARGIFVAAYLNSELSGEEANALYKDFYKDHPFTHVIDRGVDLKQAVNTNKAIISIEKHGDTLLICCAIDNLLKGASGQAVQNFNLMMGLPEDMGLRLKASAF